MVSNTYVLVKLATLEVHADIILFSAMGQTRSRDCLHGFCDEKYLPVKEHLEEMLKNGAEENLQLCVYVEGKCVIDLFGTAIRDTTYTADTLQVGGSIS